ncbi:DNA-binding MarR family transcriptional regulator [Bacillus mesophilus]|nr:MarR family transcriptional regulator [Bacillus mesophilus]MBM7662552.1 DNA-binding MarR family transcriptional regulator [Bacillus mesophilus]
MTKRDELMVELERTFQYTIRALRKGINETLGDEVNRSEFILLKYLHENGSSKVSSISNELKVTSSHITSVADSLVEKDYVTRERSLEDRRVVEITLTPTGATLFEKLHNKKTDYLFSTFDGLSNEEILTLISLFQKFKM